MYNPYLKDWKMTDPRTYQLFKDGCPIATLKRHYEFGGSVKIDIPLQDPKSKIAKSFDVAGLTIDGMLEQATNEIYSTIENAVRKLEGLLPRRERTSENAE